MDQFECIMKSAVGYELRFEKENCEKCLFAHLNILLSILDECLIHFTLKTGRFTAASCIWGDTLNVCRFFSPKVFRIYLFDSVL